MTRRCRQTCPLMAGAGGRGGPRTRRAPCPGSRGGRGSPGPRMRGTEKRAGSPTRTGFVNFINCTSVLFTWAPEEKRSCQAAPWTRGGRWRYSSFLWSSENNSEAEDISGRKSSVSMLFRVMVLWIMWRLCLAVLMLAKSSAT